MMIADQQRNSCTSSKVVEGLKQIMKSPSTCMLTVMLIRLESDFSVQHHLPDFSLL